ncbi:Uncharacterised protein [Hafnia alvei]|nr:Uncharacterised protein [Hafnia alvei]
MGDGLGAWLKEEQEMVVYTCETTPSQPPPSQGEEPIEIRINITATPSQPPPSQGEELIEIYINITATPSQGEEAIEIGINITARFPPL